MPTWYFRTTTRFGNRSNPTTDGGTFGFVASYLSEPVDSLPFSTPEKSRRYATERYQGAIGLNWYRCDPTLQAQMRRHLGDGHAWAEPHLERIGALMGGAIAERAEITDKNPPRLEKYDRWGHDVSRVVMPTTFEESSAISWRTGSAGASVKRHGGQEPTRAR
jgi:hypothetical protein